MTRTAPAFSAYVVQTNSVACDLAGNAAQVLAAARSAADLGASLLAAPAAALTGSSLGHWLRMPDFRAAVGGALGHLAAGLARTAPGMTAVVGAPVWANGTVRAGLYVLRDGKTLACIQSPRAEAFVPSEDEAEDAAPQERPLFEIGGVSAAFALAEEFADENLPETLAGRGARLVCVCDAAPYTRGVSGEARERLTMQCACAGLALIYVNAAGAQDELIYEGASFAATDAGCVTARLEDFDADARLVTADALFGAAPSVPRTNDEYETLLAALVCGVRGYVRNNGFTDVVLGLSGGADSALVAAVAVEALGKEHVHAVMMPTRFTSDLSLTLAEECARSLGIDYRIRPIGGIYDAGAALLAEDFAGTEPGLAEENLQARSRAVTLMALSNKFGWLTLSTGNKSESAAGYCTLYGDTAGAYSPIKDVLKTDVWELMRTYNRLKGREALPEGIITRAPSAELREGQTDEAALMPYDELDGILRALLERGESVEEIVAEGFKREQVERVVTLLYRSEYKRRQCPTGPRVTASCLGSGVSFPLTARPSRG